MTEEVGRNEGSDRAKHIIDRIQAETNVSLYSKDKAAIKPIIDAAFAPVVKKAEKYDMALLTTADLQVENNELVKERDDLKEKLRELVRTNRVLMVFAIEAAHIQKMLLGSREESIEAGQKLAQYNHARKEHTTALAAAEKMMGDK